MIKYDIYPKSADRDFTFIVKAQERVRDYFIFNLSENFLKYPILNLDYDENFKDSIFDTLNDDYYFTASGIILFSKKVVDILGKLDENVIFYHCKLKNQPSDIFALYKSLDNSSNYVIRNNDKPSSYFFSELFIELIKENSWNISYYQVS